MARASARQNIAAEVAAAVTRKRIRELLDAAFASEMMVDADCPECGAHGLRARAPDLKKRIDTLVALLEQAEGRPEQRAPGELTVVVERPAL